MLCQMCFEISFVEGYALQEKSYHLSEGVCYVLVLGGAIACSSYCMYDRIPVVRRCARNHERLAPLLSVDFNTKVP
jgi:hypothetical protein